MSDEEYPVTDEICDLFDSASASEECQKQAINSIWGTKRAIEFGKICIQKRRKAWALIYELYPELIDKRLVFLQNKKKVKVDTK